MYIQTFTASGDGNIILGVFLGIFILLIILLFANRCSKLGDYFKKKEEKEEYIRTDDEIRAEMAEFERKRELQESRRLNNELKRQKLKKMLVGSKKEQERKKWDDIVKDVFGAEGLNAEN